MAYDKEVFINQYPLIDEFTKHLVIHRCIKQLNEKFEYTDPFWAATSDAHLLMAGAYWCMVFGAEGSNSTHWKKLSDDENERQKFRELLFDAAEIEAGAWTEYWEDMCYFRNNYVAHRPGDYSRPVPNFDLALTSAVQYNNWVRDVIQPDKISEPSIEALIEQFEVQTLDSLGPIFEFAAKGNF